MPADLQKLQNGSDVRGVAMAIPGGGAVTLTEAACERIAAAFVIGLAEKMGKAPASLRIGVGHDSRLTAQRLKAAALRGIEGQGARAFDCGLASTPAMFMGTVFPETALDGSVMLTASHLPMERNGMKFFTRQGGFDRDDVRALLTLAEALPTESGGASTAEKLALMNRYCAHLRDKIVAGAGKGARPLSGLHIVVDTGNGAGGFFVREVLEPLGCDCSGSQFLEPDGHFPNHIPNPEDAAAMAAIQRAVLDSGAHLGLIFDTDVDRMSAVLPDGTEVNRDAIIALAAAILAPDHPGGTIVTDSVTSDRLTAFLEGELGLVHHRFKRGYKNVINEMLRLEGEGVDCPLAMETSGHGALMENYALDDGAYLAVKLVVALTRRGSLSALLEKLPPGVEETERRIPVAGEDFKEKGGLALETFRQRAQARGIVLAPTCEGVRLTLPQGWMLLRQSLHDPLLPLNAEGNAHGGCQALLAIAKELLQGLPGLDLSVLDEYDRKGDLMDAKELHSLTLTAAKVRSLALDAVYTAASGHIGGSLSVADILTVLYFHTMKVDAADPKAPGRDRLVLSKGHTSPALYAALALKGFFPQEDLKLFRSIKGHLSGHPDMVHVKGVDMSTGSLGQGISAAVGMALAGKMDKADYRVYAVLGDGELEEGQVWEALMAAYKFRLDNLCAIVDINGLQIDGSTEDVMPTEPLDKKFESFNWNVIKVDGHDIGAVAAALDKAATVKDMPTVILAKTVKGKGISFMENNAGWHGKAPNAEQYEVAHAELAALIEKLEREGK